MLLLSKEPSKKVEEAVVGTMERRKAIGLLTEISESLNFDLADTAFPAFNPKYEHFPEWVDPK